MPVKRKGPHRSSVEAASPVAAVTCQFEGYSLGIETASLMESAWLNGYSRGALLDAFVLVHVLIGSVDEFFQVTERPTRDTDIHG